MIPQCNIIEAIKSNIKSDLVHKGVYITIDKIVAIFPDAPRNEIVSTLVDMYGIQITNPATGGLFIPLGYFK